MDEFSTHSWLGDETSNIELGLVFVPRGSVVPVTGVVAILPGDDDADIEVHVDSDDGE